MAAKELRNEETLSWKGSGVQELGQQLFGHKAGWSLWYSEGCGWLLFKHRLAGLGKRNAPFLVSFLYSTMSDMIDLFLQG